MDNLALMFRQFVPGRIEVSWGAITGVLGTVTTFLFGEWNDVLTALAIAMVIDYLSGVLAAYINPNMALNSQKGFRGILKKIMILLLVALAHAIDRVLGGSMLFTVVVYFFLGNEGLSIIENAAKAGLPIPNRLKETLEQLTQEKAERAGEAHERHE